MAEAAKDEAKNQGKNWRNQLGVPDWMQGQNITTGYVQATAPQGALTYTSANLGI